MNQLLSEIRKKDALLSLTEESSMQMMYFQQRCYSI